MFTDFQRDYIKQHSETPKFKMGKWQILIAANSVLTVIGLIAISQSSEPYPESIQNAVYFGATLCLIQHLIAIPLMLLGMTIVGGCHGFMNSVAAVAKADQDLGDAERVDLKLLVDSQKMKMMRGSSLAPLVSNFMVDVRRYLAQLLLVALIAGMVMNNYMFSAVMVSISLILTVIMTDWSYRRAKNHVLTLTFSNVLAMEDKLAENGTENDTQPRIVDAVSTATAAGDNEYAYEGMDHQGNEVVGRTFALSEAEAMEKARDMGCFVTSITRD